MKFQRCLLSSSFPKRRRAIIADLLIAAVICAVVFGVHARWIYTHFSSDGYLLDSGWLAYLFESGDPLLRNPAGVNQLSFYAHHLSPHLFLFGAPLSRLFGLNGIQIFAIHQGIFFGMFFVALYLTATSARQLDWPRKGIAILVAICVGTLSNVLFQAAAYPHFEIALIALSSLALAAWLGGYRRLFVASLFWLPLVREDGGFYIAVTCLACIAVEYQPNAWRGPRAFRLFRLALLGVILSVASSFLKARLFPGFDAFSSNYSGHSWDHVSVTLVAERLRALLSNLNIVPVVIGSVILATFDIRYCAGLILLSPLYLLHLSSVRPEHGHFTLYYALPWLFPCVVWLVVFVRRSSASRSGIAESLVLLLLSLAVTAPIHAAVGAQWQFWYVAQWAITRPVVDIQAMKDFSFRAQTLFSARTQQAKDDEKHCVSMGIAAIIPNTVRPEEVLDAHDDLTACRSLLLLRGDMQYGLLSAQAEAESFESVARQDNAELWLRRRQPAKIVTK